MCPPLKEHIPPLNKSFLNEFIATLSRLARLTASREENAPLLIFNGHEIRGYFNVDDVGPVRVRSEVVHKQVVSVVNEEVESIKHLLIITNQWHLKVLVNYFFEFRFRFVFFVN